MTTLMTLDNQYPSMDDASLAQQACADPEAFAELYCRHVRSIYRYHLAHTGDVKDAEDLTSQTFMAALEGIRSFSEGEGIGLRSRWTRRFRSRPQDCRPIKLLPGVSKWISSLAHSGTSAATAPKR